MPGTLDEYETGARVPDIATPRNGFALLRCVVVVGPIGVDSRLENASFQERLISVARIPSTCCYLPANPRRKPLFAE